MAVATICGYIIIQFKDDGNSSSGDSKSITALGKNSVNDKKHVLGSSSRKSNILVKHPSVSDQSAYIKYDSINNAIAGAQTVEELSILWKEIAQTDYKGQILGNLERTLLFKIVSIGEYETAKEMIFTKYGSGSARTSLIPVLFAVDMSPDQCIERLKTLEFLDEKSAASAGYASVIASKNGFGNFVAMDWNKIARADSYFATELFANGIANILMDTNGQMDSKTQSSGVIGIVKDLERENLLNKNYIGRIIESINDKNTTLAWEVYSELSNESRSLVSTKCKESMISDFVNYDHDKALNALQQRVGDASLFDPGFASMLRKDATLASRWLEKNRQNLNQSQMDYISMASLKHAVENQQSEIAKQWVQQIQNPEIQKRALNLIK